MNYLLYDLLIDKHSYNYYNQNIKEGSYEKNNTNIAIE